MLVPPVKIVHQATLETEVVCTWVFVSVANAMDMLLNAIRLFYSIC